MHPGFNNPVSHPSYSTYSQTDALSSAELLVCSLQIFLLLSSVAAGRHTPIWGCKYQYITQLTLTQLLNRTNLLLWLLVCLFVCVGRKYTDFLSTCHFLLKLFFHFSHYSCSMLQLNIAFMYLFINLTVFFVFLCLCVCVFSSFEIHA